MRRSRIQTAVLVAMATGAAPISAELRQADIDEVTHRMDMLPEVYGQISLVYEHNHTNDGVTGGKSQFKDNESFIGARNRHEIMPGLEGFFRAEWWFNANNEDETFEKLEYAYIGVEGDFGRVWGGTDDSVYEQQLDQVANFFQSEFRGSDRNSPRNIKGPYDTGSLHGNRSRLLQYSSPQFSGWQFHGAVQLNEDGDDDAIEQHGKSSRPFQLVSTYHSGNWEWALGMDSNEGGRGPDNENTYGGRGTYERDQWSLTAQYQRREDVGNVFGFLSTYEIGPNQFAFGYERGRGKENEINAVTEPGEAGFWLEDGERVHTYTVQVMHQLSEHMRLYVEGHQAESDENAHRRDLMIGAAYSF